MSTTPFDEILYIEGMALSNTAVQIQFQRAGAKPVSYTVKSDPRGEWVLVAKVPLKPGSWEVRSRITAGQFSDWSNPRIFRVVQTGVSIGGLTITFAALSFTIVALAVLGAAAVWFFAARVRALKHVLVLRELGEVEESMRAGVSELRRDLLEELRVLEAADRRPSPEEVARREHILHELDRVERTVGKEIQDAKEKL